MLEESAKYPPDMVEKWRKIFQMEKMNFR